jgi:hypothetical protein
MEKNYNVLDEIIVTNQKELNAIPLDFKGRIYIDCTDTIQIRNKYYWRVVAYENSSVVAYGKSSVMAKENSSVEAYENSSVVAYENSSVVAYGNSSVVAWGNVQVVDRQFNGKIQMQGNARTVFMPKTIHEFMDFYGIKHNKKKAIFYKAVRKKNGELVSDRDSYFKYIVGETKIEPNCNMDIKEDCGQGIHISHLMWALDYGENWSNIAIIEVETDIDKIVMPKYTDGKVRTSEVKVLREVPLEECGLFGKMLAKRKNKSNW